MNVNKVFRVSFVALLGVLCSTSAFGQTLSMKSGTGRFEFAHAGKTIPLWYYLPPDVTSDTPVLIAMHGVNRDADRYRDEWLPHAQKRRVILVAPEFAEKDFPGNEFYSSGGVVDDKGFAIPRSAWTFSYIEPIFDAVKVAAGNRNEQYFLYGHSAGAQFVHRFLYFVPDARVAKAIAANAGWWTMPELSTEFPYGLKGSVVNEELLRQTLQRPLIVLLGTADTDPNHRNLRKTSEAMAQGPHRFARGQSFFETGKKQAAALGVDFGWTMETAPEVGHSDQGMAPFAAKSLFGPLPIE